MIQLGLKTKRLATANCTSEFVSQKFWEAGALPLGMGALMTSRNTHLPHMLMRQIWLL